MYEYIKGILTHIYPSYLVVETNGVGYHLLMANPFRYTDYHGQEVMIYLYQNVTQDAIQLFGFKSHEEKGLFLKLINVSGIGPKSALAILANEDHLGLIRAIEQEDTAFLQKFPGVGKKTASQIVLDLKGKLSELSVDQFTGQLSEELKLDDPKQNLSLEEAIEALYALGYAKREVAKVSKALEKMEKTTTDGYIREGLKLLMK
ncbi:Holliday junction branch migration protein RuvA [Marinilactibacillus piezotolerans]|uniref:Holliday junction branch migration protein RuvA n=1 Tax=Marinilactibacillus piezotolerans TaxID=258723 RepID=UPI0009B013C6|nr:Holliday junction branch migration protein RuvA [Marinilactibacillus piezotolerans]